MSHPSLAGRAVLALLLLIGFYVLALGIAAVLIWLPWAEWHYAGRVHVKLAIFAVVGAALILWSILPRPDRFQPPGITLTPEGQPRLFDLITRVARATGQAMPAEVYAVPEVNAFVAQRGGVMGVGSRRIMGLGLPLMSRLTGAQLAAVLAHEFGHYHGGDTALGPWIYKTRAAIGRTLETLSQRESIIALPFLWYGNLFVRITHGISRAQEFAADALAARTVGATPLIEGLKVVHGAGAAFAQFWTQEYVPALQSGFRPPFQAGFHSFMSNNEISAAVQRSVALELEGDRNDPFDTHPSLPARIRALQDAPAGTEWKDDSPAISLLERPDAVEHDLISWLVPNAPDGALKPIDWATVPQAVWVPQWKAFVQANQERLRGVTPLLLGSLPTRPARLAVALKLAASDDVATPEHLQAANQLFGAALAVALVRAGWDVTSAPGQPFIFTRNGEGIDPFNIGPRLAAGEVSPEEWTALCERTGLATVNLGRVLEEATQPAVG